MPIAYESNDLRKRAVIRITGPFDPSELLASLESHRTTGGWTYGLLYDLRQMTGEPVMEILREFRIETQLRPGELPRGPVAILTGKGPMYARACTYAAMTKSHGEIEVFRDLDEAESWLDDRG